MQLAAWVGLVVVIGSAVGQGDDGEKVASGPSSTVVDEPKQGASPTAGPTTAAGPTTSAAVAKTSFGTGRHRVGTDIAPGTYKSAGGSSCYWARLSGLGGSFGEIIANNLGSGPQVVTIAATDVGFESRNCGTWTVS